jgi:hypothetical protein
VLIDHCAKRTDAMHPQVEAGGAWTGVSPILVRIHTDEGLTGTGSG